MELKVWCDGIQRVVCGVSSGTTCQDVVFALAHATGQTGRFILIEKFRNNERLLAPTEHPLSVLSKWGEYANDVTFVMKRSDSNTKTNNNSNSNNSAFNTSLSSTTSPLAGNNGSGIGNSPYKKSLLLSSASSSSSSPTIPKSKTNTTTTTTTPTTISAINANTSPLKSNSSQTSSHKTDSNTSTPSKSQQLMNNTNNNNNNNNNNELSTPSKSVTSRPRHPPPYSEAISKSALITSANTNSSHNSSLNQSIDERNNKRRSVEPSPQTQKLRNNSQKELLLSRDALRLVDMQKETMKTQEKEMLSLEQQITNVEKKLAENEILIKRYKEEMESLHQLWLEQEVMIDKLDQNRLDQELDELVNESKQYEEEVVIMKKKLSNCEGDIADCRQQITKLMDKLEDNEKCIKLNQLEKEENDRLMSEQLKNALKENNRDFEAQKCDLKTITNSITNLDKLLHEKQTLMDKLLNDLKEANIQGLALQPGDDVSNKPFHHRSGSTRRIIGSPRELENAVATNKNPHGVWV